MIPFPISALIPSILIPIFLIRIFSIIPIFPFPLLLLILSFFSHYPTYFLSIYFHPRNIYNPSFPAIILLIFPYSTVLSPAQAYWVYFCALDNPSIPSISPFPCPKSSFPQHWREGTVVRDFWWGGSFLSFPFAAGTIYHDRWGFSEWKEGYLFEFLLNDEHVALEIGSSALKERHNGIIVSHSFQIKIILVYEISRKSSFFFNFVEKRLVKFVVEQPRHNAPNQRSNHNPEHIEEQQGVTFVYATIKLNSYANGWVHALFPESKPSITCNLTFCQLATSGRWKSR